MSRRRCTECQQWLSASRFGNHTRLPGGKQQRCVSCISERKSPNDQSAEYINNVGYHCMSCKSMVDLPQAWISLSETNGIMLEDVRIAMKKSETVFYSWFNGTATPSIRTQQRACELLDAGTLYEKRFSKLRVETYCKKCLELMLEKHNLSVREAMG